ncbi:topoisomerase DNA-binding C4 zinc finger domain-containing protein [Paenibacillus thailandensis]|uniref:Topoisomerase DNA-binding C4 zinc finger domain-containing protein n=1 Tax=Paenibacillus thailandensis TaxID=393250 RepID=A0ABW5QZH1_9BACL
MNKAVREAAAGASLPSCPACGSYMVQRKNKEGKSFYGCSNYPKCRTTKSI